MPTDQMRLSLTVQVPFSVQLIAWLSGVIACFVGMLNLIAEWDPGQATVQFVVLLIAPAIWMIEGRPRVINIIDDHSGFRNKGIIVLALLVGLVSLMTCILVGRRMVDLPPAYHDEYSYLFQARTLLMGQLSVPSFLNHPEIFDQVHVLNEGRMASRYYPGTGLWMAPWVALGHPYWGQWLASSLTSMFVFWTGYELGRTRVALVSGLACALSPGIALFANLLLAHQATLVGLSIFVWAFIKWQRTRVLQDAFLAGCGLSFAMLCRPATAAGVGLPFGISFVHWLVTTNESSRTIRPRLRTLFAMGSPLVFGWAVMLAYNNDVTGSWTTSPYQLYTDIYTPRHVYGFNNVIRGEQKLGPKVLDAYDRWAINLTPELAVKNLSDRWLTSWLWTLDLLPLLLSAVVYLGTFRRWDQRWIGIGLAIISLHAIHVPYWYTGIMGWHYVFESAMLWCLVLGLVTDLLFRDWLSRGRWLMTGWWVLLLTVSVCGDYLPVRSMGLLPKSGVPRIANAISSIRHPRRLYAEFDLWLQSHTKELPAVVLIETDPTDQHIDYITNRPDFTGTILRARFHRGQTDVKSVAAMFPGRAVYFCDPKRGIFDQIRSIKVEADF